MRNSSIELLRIIAMFSIVIGHIFYHGFHGQLYEIEWLKPFTCCGVNIFILISGYFGIKFKLESILNLLLMVSFYTAISGIIEFFLFGHAFALSRMSGIVLPFSGNHYYWFITCYVVLYLLSPIINEEIGWLYKKNYLNKACLLFLYVNCISGWLIGNSLINRNGFCIMQFIFLYVIGRTLNLYGYVDKIKICPIVGMYILLFVIGASPLNGGVK